MTKVMARISMSVDGYIAGPNDVPGNGMGDGGEALHSWMFGGPRENADEAGQAAGVDKEFLDGVTAAQGAVIGGRTMFDLAEAWGGSNPYPVPMFILTHRTGEQPAEGGFTFVGSLDEALRSARKAAGDRAVAIAGGASTIRQALGSGVVDELSISIAPVVLGGGKRLFEGFDTDVPLEQIRVLHSPLATHITYRVRR